MSKYKNKELICPNCCKTYINKRRDRFPKFCSKSCSSKYRHKNNGLQTFNVDNWKLKEYVTKATLCEICGKAETTNSSNQNPKHINKLCKDHNHKTENFRGVICSTCNRALGWYENNASRIKEYLFTNNDFKNVILKVNSVIRE